MKARKIIIIDLMPLVFRAYFATLGKNLSTAAGLPTGGILGFYNYIFQLIFEEKPDVIIATHDSAPEERLAIDPGYKANRQESPEELEITIGYAFRLLSSLNIPVYTISGQEADDVIGSICSSLNHSDRIYLVSPDKDLAQLVNDHVFLMRPAYKGHEFNILDVKGVEEKFGVPPAKIPDLLALMGDTVDNIKGIPGVGEKTAAKLLASEDNIESLYKNVSSMKEGKLKENLIVHKDEAIRSKKLATIRCDLDVHTNFQEFSKDNIRHDHLVEILEELEFRNLSDRLAAKGFLEKHELVEIHKAKKAEKLKDLGSDLVSIEHVPGTDELILSAKNKILIEKTNSLKDLPSKFDLIICRDLKSIHKEIGISFDDISRYYDVSIAEYLLNPDKTIDLDHLARKYRFAYPLPDMKAQAEQLCLSLEQMYMEQGEGIDELDLRDLMYKIEMPLALVLGEMENNGVYMDMEILESTGNSVLREIHEVEGKMHQIAGREFNINSVSQTGVILQELLGAGLKKTKTGKISSSEKILEDHIEEHPFVPLLLRYRKLSKLYGTYINSLPKFVSSETGRIHATFSQVTAGTGRLSCHTPNLQNLPVRDEIGRIIRKALRTNKEDYEIISADYSQVELRILASLSEDPNLIKAFEEDQDIHAITASRILKIPLTSVTENDRGIAKGVNFGIVYGITPFGLSDRLKIPQKEAKEFIESYFAAFPRVKEFQENTLEFAREHGYTRTLTGRIRYIEGINSRNGTTRKNAERVALNAPIQGLAADLIKAAMIKCHEFILSNNPDAKMILQIHDELLFECPKSQSTQFMKEIRSIMETALSFDVPLKVEIGHGPDWMDLEYE